MGRKPITFTKADLAEVERLASLGLNEKHISEALGVAYSTFQSYKHDFREPLKRGRSALRERITSALFDKCESGDTTALIFTAKRLNLFQPTIEAKAPSSIKEALSAMGETFGAYASGEITDTQADKMVQLLNGYIKAVELNEIEERISQLEESKK